MRFSIKRLKRSLLARFGYYKIENKHKIINGFDAQRMMLSKENISVIIDAGANIGDTAVIYRNFFPKSTVHCFEPYPPSFGKMKQRLSTDPLVKPIPMALSNLSGNLQFHVNEANTMNSLLLNDTEGELWSPHGSMNPKKPIEVPTITIDEYCSKEDIKHISILKMDTQGSELLVLQGAENLLHSGAISVIYSEALFVSYYKNQAYFHDLSLYLSKFNYTLYDMFDRKYAQNGQLKHVDALFISPKIKEDICMPRLLEGIKNEPQSKLRAKTEREAKKS